MEKVADEAAARHLADSRGTGPVSKIAGAVETLPQAYPTVTKFVVAVQGVGDQYSYETDPVGSVPVLSLL